MFTQMPLFVYRHFTGAVCTTSSDGRFALFSAPSTAAFSLASGLSNSSDILLSDIFRGPCRGSPVARTRFKGAGACGGCGFNEQMFGADKQVPRRGRRHLTSVRPSLCRADGPNCTSIRFANLPRPKVEAGAFFHSWQRRTNLWRGRTNLRTGSERLRGVMRRLDPQALAFFGPGHPWWWHPRPQMLR